MSSSCQKRRRGPGPSKAEGRSRERGTATQREREREDRVPESRGQRPRERGTDSGKKLQPRPGKTHSTTDWGAGALCHQERQNKGPRRPLPQFPTTPIRGGAGRRGHLPSGPSPSPSPRSPPPPSPAPGTVGSDPTQVPSDFPEAGNGGKTFSNTVRSRLPGGSTSSTAFPGPQSPGPHPPPPLDPGAPAEIDKDPRPSPVALRRSGPP